MKQIKKQLTYANVMSTIAVFLVIGGASAFAAVQLGKNTVGTKQLKKNAVTTAKIKKQAVAGGKIKNGAVGNSKLAAGAVSADKIANDAVSTDKIAGSAVTSAKLADNGVTNGKIANDAVTAAKLAPSERSEAFQVWEEGLVNAEMATGLLGNYSTGTLALSTALPAGNYVVTASTQLLNSTLPGEERSAICRLFDDGAEIADGSTVIGQLIIVTQGTVTVTGISNGGTLALRCRASGDKVFSFDRKITAIKVGSVG